MKVKKYRVGTMAGPVNIEAEELGTVQVENQTVRLDFLIGNIVIASVNSPLWWIDIYSQTQAAISP